MVRQLYTTAHSLGRSSWRLPRIPHITHAGLHAQTCGHVKSIESPVAWLQFRNQPRPTAQRTLKTMKSQRGNVPDLLLLVEFFSKPRRNISIRSTPARWLSNYNTILIAKATCMARILSQSCELRGDDGAALNSNSWSSVHRTE